jgi:catechol 2,3-dioxygenase-like lactoylglutathione lyase family enzyme
MTVTLNGIAHVYVTVADFAAARPFYGVLLPFLDMECLIDTDVLYYCVGSRTGIAIRAASAEHADTPFDQYRAGLHHLCFRARSREDVDAVAAFVAEAGGRIVHGPREDDWAPGYYSVLFEDPCGTRLEVNYVPGKGNLDESIELPLPAERQARLSEP